MTTKKTIIPVKTITSWSFSRYSDYRQCPLKAKLKHLDKISEPPNAAMARGAAIHTLAEKYIKGEGRTCPPELAKFKPEFAELRKQFKKRISGMVVEDTWAFRKDWTQTAWNDWAECWVRIKLDLATIDNNGVITITDWKTGKFRPEQIAEYVEQLELYALAALVLNPHAEQARPRLVYLDVGVVYPTDDELVFTQADVPKLKKTWEKRVKAMMLDTTFAPRPNDKCHWCFYRAGNKASGGGQCKF